MTNEIVYEQKMVVKINFLNQINRLIMGYKRRQKEIERQDKKRRRDFKSNIVAKDLHTSKYRQRVVPNKKKHDTLELNINTVLKDYE